jgi:hypothetical protein
MTRTWTCAVLTLSIASALACGGAERKKTEEATKAIEQAARQMEEAGKKMETDAATGAADMAKGLEGLARGFGALAGGSTDAVEPVSFRELQTVFPELPGWEMGKSTGEKMTSPVSFSKASVTYRKGEAQIEASLVDSGFNQLLLLPYAWISNMGYEKETESGYEKAVKVAGHPGFEKWDGAGREAEVNAFVSKRFILQLEGSNVDDARVLHQLAEAANLGKLAAMK